MSAHMPSSAIEAVAVWLVLASMGFWVVVLFAARSFARRPRRVRPAKLPPVTLLVPLCGADARAEEVYEAFCSQDYPDYQVVFGVHDGGDPSVPLVRALMASLPGRDIELVVGEASIGSNPKVNNLHNIMVRARHETVVMADADILVSPDFLAQVVPPLAEARVGLVTCLYRSSGARGAAARLEAVGIAGEFAPRVLVAAFAEGVRFGLGATLATTQAVLRSVGGLEAVAHYLAEDFRLGSLIAEAGYEVHLSSQVVETVVAPANMRAMLRHQLRWGRTIRACRPVGYLGLLVSHTTALALLSLLVDHETLRSLLLPAAAVLLQGLGAWVVGVRVLGDGTFRRSFWLFPVRDLLGFGIWCASLLGRSVEWRGSTFTLAEDGKLTAKTSA